MENVDKVIAEILEGGETSLEGGRKHRRSGSKRSHSRRHSKHHHKVSAKGAVGETLRELFGGSGFNGPAETQPISGGAKGFSPFSSLFDEPVKPASPVQGGKKRSRVRGGKQAVKGGSVAAVSEAPIAGGVIEGVSAPAAPIAGGSVVPAVVSIAGDSIVGGSSAPIAGGSAPSAPIVGGSAPSAQQQVPADAVAGGAEVVEAVTGGASKVAGGKRRRNSAVRETHSRVMAEYHRMKKEKEFRRVPGNILLRMAMERSKKR